MPIYVERMTPRMIADAVVCAVMDAAVEYHQADRGTQTVKLGDAVLEALKDCGIELVPVALEDHVRHETERFNAACDELHRTEDSDGA